MKLVYSPKYEVDIGSHVFPTDKYRLVYERLIEEGAFGKDDFLLPVPADDEDVLLVHNITYVDKLKKGTLSLPEIMQLELPYSPELVEVAWLWVGGTVMAARQALEDGICVHLGGGWHHAFPDHGEGFCALNDHAIAVRRLLKDKAVKKAAIVDCDVHQGNGTAAIFAGDSDVFTFSIHQENNYPMIKPPSDIDVGLEDGATDSEYLTKVHEHLPRILKDFKPGLVVYVAGADTYVNDQLGGLSLTVVGHKERDRLVIGEARRAGIPVVIVLAGGYAVRVEDTVTIHANTAKIAKELTVNRE